MSIIAPWDCTTVAVILSVSPQMDGLHADVIKALPEMALVAVVSNISGFSRITKFIIR